MSDLKTPAEHYEEASLLLHEDLCTYGCPHSGCPHELAGLLRARIHAMLAATPAAVAAEAADLNERRGQLAALTPQQAGGAP